MLENLKLKIIKLILKKYFLGWAIKGYTAVKGYKTQIFVALAILTWIGEMAKVIPQELAKQLYEVFGAGGSITFMQKLSRYQPVIEELVEESNKEVQNEKINN